MQATPVKKTKFLEYFAFFIMYIGSFAFINKKYTEIIGFGLLFVVNTAFMFFSINDMIQINNQNFISLLSRFAVVIGVAFHFISIIFILMMLNNLNKKFSGKRGTPIDLPPKYVSKINDFKQIMIACFSLGVILVIMLLRTKMLDYVVPDTFSEYISSLFVY